MTSQKVCDCNQGRRPCTCKPEDEHGLQASAAKQRIDEQAKPVPPAGEYAVQQLADLRARLAKYEDAERAAFEAWYETTYGISLEPEFRANHFIGYVNDKANHRWAAWQARAALSAPSHSEQVREGLPAALFNALEAYKKTRVHFHKLVDQRKHDEQCELIRQHAAQLLAAVPSAACQHRFMFFGDQPKRRCADCCAVEDTAPSAGSQGGDV